MAVTTEPGERLARLEGAYEHLATKADIERLRTDIVGMESKIIKWLVGTVIASTVAASAIASAIAIWIAP